MKNKTLRVAFIDNCIYDNILAALRTEYDVIIDEKEPDIVFYGNFGLRHLRYTCTKVFVSVECVAPDFNECDYAITCCQIDFNGRNLFVPPAIFLHLTDTTTITTPLDTELAHRPFCSFIYSQRKYGEGSQLRAIFCEKLMKYKKVDCPGKVLHNTEAPELAARSATDWNSSKIKFIGKYKFNIAFENSNSRGYISEKLPDPLLANTVPIYWGSEGDLTPFPKEAVICANDYPNLDALIERVKEVDQNDDEYLRILAANPLRNGMTLSIWKEFCAFVLRAADVSKRPQSNDPVAYSDMPVLRTACRNRFIMAMILLHTTVVYGAQRLCLLFLKGKKHDDMLVASSKTKRVAYLMVDALFLRPL